MIYLIDKIKQKNSGNFFLVDAADVECSDGSSLETKLENLESSSGSGSGTTAEVATDDEVTEALNDIFGTTETEESGEETGE